MDAPDASGTESPVLQAVIEIGDCLLCQVREHHTSDAGDDVAVNQIAVPAFGVAVPYRRLLLANEQYHRKQEIATEKNGISSGK